MFQPWVKRSSLKQRAGRRSLLIAGSVGSNPILLLSIVAVFIVLGVFVVSKSYAASYFGH
jgi:hypothetical protein